MQPETPPPGKSTNKQLAIAGFVAGIITVLVILFIYIK